MTREDTIKILSVLKAAYPHSFKDITKRDAEALIQLWSAMFFAESYEEISAAVAALISTRTVGSSPTIGEVKEQLQRLRAVDSLSAQDAWSLVSKACCNGLYGYRKEFEKLPPEVQRAVGAPEQIREWAKMDEDTVQSVVASNFMRNYRAQQTREKERAMLPPEIQKVLGGIADNMKMLNGAEQKREGESS